MGVRGVDLSEHQSALDVESVLRANDVGFALIRTNYGANHDDQWFQSHADAAERAGALVVPYVYILASDILGSIDDAVRVAGGRYESIVVDWEAGSGGGAELRRAHELLWERGLNTPVVYDPKWYWESVGSPDLSWMQGRVRGHWKSWYPDNTPRSFDDALGRVPTTVWNDNRGGIPTVIVQFTSTGRLNGYGGNLDLNYFPGSRAELATLLGGDDEMNWETFKEFQERYEFFLGRPDGNDATWEQGPSRKETFKILLDAAKKVSAPAPVQLTPEDRAEIVKEIRAGLADEVANLLAARLKE